MGHKTKVTRSGQGSWFSFVSCEMQGWRPAMEDALVCNPSLSDSPETALFAVFDGHGGAEVSAHAAEHIVERVSSCLLSTSGSELCLKESLLEIENDLRSHNQTHHRYNTMGCTAAVALLSPESLAVASVGDSRIFKCRHGQCVPLTRDHKPDSPRERRRIEAANGSVIKLGPCYRVDYCLNMSRALGDFNFKDANLAQENQKISPVGDTTVVAIDQFDEFLVLACDGLFELMTWESVCEFIRQRIHNTELTKIAEELLDECCSPNLLATCGRGTDNESVIIVNLHKPS